jgi:hypothetical protein
MKRNFLIQGVCILMLGWSMSGCNEKYDKDIEKNIYVNKNSVSIFVGDRLQLTASPVGVTYGWISEDTGIVTVTADGVVDAVGAGSTNIVVSHDDIHKIVPVTATLRVPLTGIIVDIESLQNVAVGAQVQVNAVPVPANATEVSFVWSSENAAVATVSVSGKIEAVGAGSTHIVVSQGNIRKEISVTVIKALDKTAWSVISCSDEQVDDGGGKDMLIDGIIASTNYWHSHWRAPAVPLPHWAIIDMVSPRIVNRIDTYRPGTNTYAKSVQYFVSNDPDPDATSWVKIMEGTFPITGDLLTLNAPENIITGRYLKIFLPDSNSGDNTNVSEINVYGK